MGHDQHGKGAYEAMIFFSKLVQKLHIMAQQDMTLLTIRVSLTAWALMVAVLAWLIDSKAFLAGLFLYEVLP